MLCRNKNKEQREFASGNIFKFLISTQWKQVFWEVINKIIVFLIMKVLEVVYVKGFV